MKSQYPSNTDSAVAAARWIGFAPEIIQVLSAPTQALEPAIQLLARLSETLALHAARGIPESVTRETLRDMELWLYDYKKKHAEWGYSQAMWSARYFNGELYALGRLQFEIGYYHLPALKGLLAPGDPVLFIHIPARGKLDDEACGQSFRSAAEFFPRHFPEHKFKAFVCQSWMLSRQLEQLLPADSNLVRFFRRFRPVERPDATDRQMWERVFGRYYEQLSDAPSDTALQRVILRYIGGGGQWQDGAGYILREEID